MKNFVRAKSRFLGYLFFLALLLNISCNQSVEKNQEYEFDLLGDIRLEKIIIENNLNNHFVKDLSVIYDNQKKEKIISILPMRDSTFVSTTPKIENIYLQANNIQSKNKGLRIIIRNTDIIPDCLSMDLIYKKKWIIERFILSNTNSQDSLFIIEKKVNNSVENEFGIKKVFDPKMIMQKYFNK